MIARRSLLRELVLLCVVVGGLLLVWSAPALAQRKHAFGFSFGSEGSGAGQLMDPGLMAVNDSTGDVYVLDRGNDRVEIFSASGAFIGQFNGSESPTGPFTFGTNLSPRRTAAGQPQTTPDGAIAVDNSTNPLDPSKGDVYVLSPIEHNSQDTGSYVDKFTASGQYIGQLVGSPTSSFGITGSGVAVDPNGGLWVEIAGFGREVFHFNDAAPVNEYISTLEIQVPPQSGEASRTHLAYIGFAMDSEENLYAGIKNFLLLGSEPAFPAEFSSITGQPLLEQQLNEAEETTGVAVDESSNDVYYDHETNVVASSPAHHAIEQFGTGQLQGSEGIAVDSATGTVYASDSITQSIDVFPAFVVPDASTGEASDLAETSATVNGVVNPDGLPITSCVFEYGASEAYGQSEPCEQTPAQIGSGSSLVAVSAHLTGLSPLSKYHFRLSVANANGSNQGLGRTFVAPQSVGLTEEAVSDVASTSALFSAQVDPGGVEATYSFDYGTSESYGESVPAPAGVLGAGTTGSVLVSARVEGLLGETTYHMRVVAHNLLGTVYGPDRVFTTQSAGGAFMLPDGRAWELVSPPNKSGARIFPPGGARAQGIGLIEASAEGNAIAYLADGPIGSGVQGNANPFGFTRVLSRRGASGWSSEDITTPQQTVGNLAAPYVLFSSDLKGAIVNPISGMPLLSPEATEETPYLRDDEDGSYLPLASAGDVPPGTKFNSGSEFPEAVAATPDLSHVIIKGGGLFDEWSGGQLQSIPGGGVLGFLGPGEEDVRNALSSNGSIVFTSSLQGELFISDMVTGKAVRVDAPAPGVSPPPRSGARFEIANTSGSRVFFLDEEPLTLSSKLQPVTSGDTGPNDLYVYEPTAGVLTDLSVDQNAGEAANVHDAVVGASEDGSIVYFVATGRLAPGAQAGQDNLYVESYTGSEWSTPRLVAVLAPGDSPDWSSTSFGRISRVSGNGRYLAFMSDRSLTGYDNRDAVSGQPDLEVFLYDEMTGVLKCVSCDPTGARPEGVFDPSVGEELNELLVDSAGIWGGQWLAGSIPGSTGSSEDEDAAYQSRVLSGEGRLFFDSPESLVPQATNGKEDVYEYEPRGVGGCASAEGCVSLVSSGVSSEESALLDASESGSNVFFMTAARLVPADVDAAYDVYDAHVCSVSSPCVSAPLAPPPCASGDACKAAPSPQPAIFGAPSSATFSGAGNVVSSPSAAGVGARQGAGAKRKVSRGKPSRGGGPKGKRRRGRSGNKKRSRVRGGRRNRVSKGGK